MKDCPTLSYQCKTGDHKHCGYIWIGANGQEPKVRRMICHCDCKHRPQRQAQLEMRLLGRDR